MTISMHSSFVAEARACLSRAEQVIRTFDRGLGMADVRGVEKCYRDIHTITGLAGFLSLSRIQKLARMLECLLDEMRTNRLRRNGGRIATLLRGLQRVKELVDHVDQGTTTEGDDDEHVLFVEIRSWFTVKLIRLNSQFTLMSDLLKHKFLRLTNQITTGPPGCTGNRLGVS